MNFLFVLMLLLLPAAAPDSAKVEVLDEATVSAGHIPVQFRKSARQVTVLDARDFEAMSVESVNDILKLSAGTDVRQRGPMGMQTDISVRGGTFDQIAVLLDGVNISDPQTGHNAADFPIDLSQIERIEILEGPAARTYGASSLVGAINVISKKAESNGLSAFAEGGSYGYFDGGASASLTHGPWSGSLSGSYARSDGYSRNSAGGLNSDFSAGKAFYKGAYSSNAVDVSWHAGMSVKDFGSNTFYSPKYDDQFEHTFKTFAAVQAVTKGRVKVRPMLYWNHSADRFELFRGNPAAVAFNHHLTNVAGANLSAWLETKAGKTALGADIRHEGIVSTNLGDPMDNPIPVKGYDAEYKCSLDRTNYRMFLEHALVLERLTVSAGVDASLNSGNKEGFVFCPGINASYAITDGLRAYAGCNTSSRMPSFTELYYSVGGHKADKNLKAEKMTSVEGGLKFDSGFISASGNIWWHYGREMIDWIMDTSAGADAQWQSVNFTSIKALGEELSLRMNFPAILGDSPLRSLSLSYGHITQDKEETEGILSKYALEYLRNKVVANLKMTFFKKLSADLTASWLDRVGSYSVYKDKTDTGTVSSFSPYTLVDLRLSWAVTGNVTMHLDAYNLLDRVYYDLGNIPQPGIWVKAGVKINLAK